ncbi:hypothetical protein QLS71_013255 [Mariniflexile litorale]|uniref:Uncharacterized protein n=1 Tax=Mariniflexile litorale TaxID=3045158 RepID=A0AAU7ECZ0_9FLAO|nr:hypothetical protein [Mariniflexile sp. KMM 9835]MDQ8212174.1 hypothetical protein [Mariniflexile sp. KMM 9835]
MKPNKIIVIFLAVIFSSIANAQEAKATTKTQIETKSYYEQRAIEDAKYEQQFIADNKDEEDTFWDEQKAYEKDLKKKNKKAYKAYMKGKKEAYASHYSYCDAHCHHSDNYYHHASFYYYRYDNSHHTRYPQRSTINTRVNVRTPRVSLGLF